MHRRIRHWRQVAGLSKTELARACGVSQSAVSQWEDGNYSPPTLKNLAKIAKACGVELRTFFGPIPDVEDEESDSSGDRHGGGGGSMKAAS